MTTETTPNPKYAAAARQLTGYLGLHSDDLVIETGDLDPAHAAPLGDPNPTETFLLRMHRPGVDMHRPELTQSILQGIASVPALAALAAQEAPVFYKPIGRTDVMEVRFKIRQSDVENTVNSLFALPAVFVCDPENPAITAETVAAENIATGRVAAPAAPAMGQNAHSDLASVMTGATVGLGAAMMIPRSEEKKYDANSNTPSLAV